MDKDPSRYKPGLVDHGYRVPEPALLITGQSLERRKLFMTNWLAVRHLWISRLDHNPPHRFPSPQLWREFLHSIPSLEGVQTPCPSQVVGKKMYQVLAVEQVSVDAKEGGNDCCIYLAVEQVYYTRVLG